MKKYHEILWATIDDALEAQRAEALGLVPVVGKTKEGYLVFRYAFQPVDKAA